MKLKELKDFFINWTSYLQGEMWRLWNIRICRFFPFSKYGRSLIDLVSYRSYSTLMLKGALFFEIKRNRSLDGITYVRGVWSFGKLHLWKIHMYTESGSLRPDLTIEELIDLHEDIHEDTEPLLDSYVLTHDQYVKVFHRLLELPDLELYEDLEIPGDL